MSQPRIFLSYRRSDCQAQATSIYYGLKDRIDAEVFFDVDAIQGGEDFMETIEREISSSDVVLVLIGDDWLSLANEEGRPRLDDPADYVRTEIELAMARGIPIVPVRVEGAEMPTADQLPANVARLATMNALEVSDQNLFHDIEVLANQVRRIAERTPPEPPPPEPETLEAPAPRILDESDEVGRATVAAAGILVAKDRDLLALGKNIVERDLGEALASEIDGAKLEQKWVVPNWDPQPGRFDLIVESPDGRPQLALETKLKDTNDIFECLWDALKLLSLGCLDHVTGTYIVAGTTVANWQKPIHAASMFESGEHSITGLIGEVGDWWQRYMLPDSAGRPRWGPTTAQVELVAAVPLTIRNAEWELRAIRLESVATDWVSFPEGSPPADASPPAPTEAEDAPTDTVVVAASLAYPDYLSGSVYICQPNRFPQSRLESNGVTRFGFYRDRAVQPELPLILDNRENVVFTRDEANRLRATGDQMDAKVADAIDTSLEGRTIRSRDEGSPHQVLVLSPPDDARTLNTGMVLHEGRSAWTQQHRYAAADRLVAAITTADLDGTNGHEKTPRTPPRDTLDFARARAFIESIPEGRWSTYKDVATAAGAPKGAQAVGMWLSREDCSDLLEVYRVLRSDGTVSEGFGAEESSLPQSPAEVRTRLESDGIVFDAKGKAHTGFRWRASDWSREVSGDT